MFGGQVAVPGRHRNRFVASSLLNLFDARSRHRQPGTERVPVAAPHIAADARVFHAGVKPGAGIETALAASTREDGIGGVLLRPQKRLDGMNGIRVQMDRAGRTVLRLR